MTSLRMRIFAAISLVSLLGLLVGALVARTLAPEQFARRLGQGFGRRAEPQIAAIEQVFTDALQNGLLIGTLVAVLAALAIAAIVARSLTRSVDEVRDATRNLAGGDYSIRVPDQRVRELVELSSDINTLAGELEKTERRRTQLIGNVAHELRTPLTTIEGYMEGLSDGVFEPSTEIFTTVGSEAARLRRLSNDLIDLARAEETERPAAHEQVAIQELLRGVADRLGPQFDDQSVALVLDLRSQATVLGSSDQLVQLFMNLIGNALGHTPPGGTVEVRMTVEDDLLRVSISDTGDGIAASELDRIFERFYRAPAGSPPARASGSGIGLTIARSVARAHGGDIVAFSEGPGRGSCFTVMLPMEPR